LVGAAGILIEETLKLATGGFAVVMPLTPTFRIRAGDPA
jgi:hypothetical protein